MLIEKSVKEYLDLMDKAVKFERYFVNDSNSAKNIRCYQAVAKCLQNLNPEIVLTVESARGKANRPFEMPNIGSLMECVLKIVLDKEPCDSYSKEFSDDKADTKIGWCEYEIKASMGAVSLNTKIVADKPILFVNSLGVFSIRKDKIADLIKNGKLPYNKAVGKAWVGLMRKLGFID